MATKEVGQVQFKNVLTILPYFYVREIILGKLVALMTQHKETQIKINVHAV